MCQNGTWLHLFALLASTLEATCNARCEEMGPIPFLCLLTGVLLIVCDMMQSSILVFFSESMACTTYEADHGVALTCGENQIVQSVCTSGKNDDCGSGIYTRIHCCTGTHLLPAIASNRDINKYA